MSFQRCPQFWNRINLKEAFLFVMLMVSYWTSILQWNSISNSIINSDYMIVNLWIQLEIGFLNDTESLKLFNEYIEANKLLSIIGSIQGVNTISTNHTSLEIHFTFRRTLESSFANKQFDLFYKLFSIIYKLVWMLSFFLFSFYIVM